MHSLMRNHRQQIGVPLDLELRIIRKLAPDFEVSFISLSCIL